MMFFLITLAAVLLAVVVLPASRKATVLPEDTQRTELLEEREILTRELQDLQTQNLPADQLERAELTYKARLARVLGALDLLPPIPSSTVLSRPAHLSALLVMLLSASVVVVGAFSFFPSWRYTGLGQGEAKQLQNVLKLPELRFKAQGSSDPAVQKAYAQAAFDAGEFKDAAQAYTEVLRQNARDPEALRRLGVYLTTVEQFKQQGLSLVQSAVQLEPKTPEGHLLLGYAYQNNGALQQALDSFLKYRDLEPSSLEADDPINQLKAALGETNSGAEIYAQNCAACHGKAGEGKTAPSLLNSAALNDANALKTIIQHGAGAMPAFPKLTGKTLDALVQHLQGLKK